MRYNFSEMINRRNTNSGKWDVAANYLPRWVAAMHFRTAPGIVDAINRKAGTGIFGYEEVPAAYFEAVQHWYATEHDWAPNTDWMRFVTGVVPAISSAVRRRSEERRVGKRVGLGGRGTLKYERHDTLVRWGTRCGTERGR